MSDTRHGLGPVKLDGTPLDGIIQCRVDTGTDVEGEAASGDVRQKPKATFTTRAIALALTFCRLFGRP